MQLSGRSRTGHLAILLSTVVCLSTPSAWGISWNECLRMEAAWYRSAEAVRIADNVLYYQAEIGGWYKNDGSIHKSGNAATEVLSPLERRKHKESLEQRKYPCTLDNGATHSEMRYLAKVYAATGRAQDKEGFLKGVRYLLKAQYASGGWAQFYPLRPGYSSRITYNDDAMIGALSMLDDVTSRPPYQLADETLLLLVRKAVERGRECVLKCQIVVDGKKTAWCQQHDQSTLKPARGRVSELPSISGAESVAVVRYLMSIDHPSPDMIEAVEGAVRWFEEAKITGVRVVMVEDGSLPGGRDKRVIKDPKAPAIWARYHEIGTNKAMFIEEGVVKYSLAELSLKHRVGHRWIGGKWPARLLEVEYPAWRRKWAAPQRPPGR